MISWTTIKVRGGRVNVGWMKVICKLIVYELSYYFHCIVYSWLSPFVPTPLPFPCPRLKVSLNVWYYNRLVHHLASPSDKAKHFQPWKLTPRRLRQIRQLRQDPDWKRPKAYELHCSSDPVSASDERQLQPYRQRQPSQRQRQRQTTPTTPK